MTNKISYPKIVIAAFLIPLYIVAFINSCHVNPAYGQKRVVLPELSPNSTQCENLVKEFSYKGHTIVRVDCSGSYSCFHSPECPKCSK